MIKTVTLSGKELKVDGLGGFNTIVHNLSEDAVYASKLPNIKAGADDVAEIPAGAAKLISTTNGTVYLLGDGKAELTGQDHDGVNFRQPSSSGGGGGTSDVTKEYVSKQDAINLEAAKEYTDSALNEAKERIDEVRSEIPTTLPANGGNADTVNGHTVNADVPSDAKFTDTTYSDMIGASATKAGKNGLVPAPAKGEQTKYLRGDGTWQTPPDTTYSAMTGATETAAGKSGLVPAPAIQKAPRDTFLAADGSWQSPFSITVQTGGDLNDYVTAGFFAWGGNSLPQNVPSQNSGQLLVLRNSDNFVKQIWFRNGSLNSDYDSMVYLRTFSNGTWSDWRRFITNNNIFTGATASAAGAAGLVPVPAAGNLMNYLSAGGGWKNPFKPTRIETAGTDANTYVTSGIYYFYSTESPLHAPISGINGWLLVTGFEGGEVKQVWFRLGGANSTDSDTFVRTKVSGVWSNWRKLATAPAAVNPLQIVGIVQGAVSGLTFNQGVYYAPYQPGATRALVDIWRNLSVNISSDSIDRTVHSTIYLSGISSSMTAVAPKKIVDLPHLSASVGIDATGRITLADNVGSATYRIIWLV